MRLSVRRTAPATVGISGAAASYNDPHQVADAGTTTNGGTSR
ncbi:hypothetical protein ACFCZQ_07800 [Streptomyces virginiae]|nr:hypothetical protein [Streptomyces bambusae]